MHSISVIAFTFFLNIVCKANPVDWNTINYGVDWSTINYGNADGSATTTQTTAQAVTTSQDTSVLPAVQVNNKVVDTNSATTSSSCSSSSSSNSGSSNSGLSSLSGSGIAFSQYTSNGQCKSSNKLAQAIKALSSYSVDFTI